MITLDIKSFHYSDITFKVSQILTINPTSILLRKNKLIEELNNLKKETNSNYVVLLITDIKKNGSYLIYDSSEFCQTMLETSLQKGVFQGIFLEGVVSRKKQIVPLLIEEK